MRRFSKRAAALIVLVAFAATSLTAEEQSWLSFHVSPGLVVAVGENDYITTSAGAKQAIYNVGVQATLAADATILPFLMASVNAGILTTQTNNTTRSNLSIVRVGAGPILFLNPSDTFRMRLGTFGGFYSASLASSTGAGVATTASNWFVGAQMEVGLRISPGFSILGSVELSTYFGTKTNLITALVPGVTLDIDPAGLSGNGKIKIKEFKAGSVFPAFYTYYDTNAFGSVKLANDEDYDISDLKVFFRTGKYMDQPKLCLSLPLVRKGATVEAPLRALFSDDVLSLTEDAEVPAEVTVQYQVLGAPRVANLSTSLEISDRNAMNWSDDRHAAAFVSPKDPAALWFSKYVTGIVSDRTRGDINRNLQLAMGMFQAEQLYGLNYVVDPSSSYATRATTDESSDFLQFPYQTLMYRGGDCDDLSILFASLMESVGIQSAFITIPGHIFMAFSLDLSEADARAQFADPSLFIFRDGRTWVPLEITLVREDFNKAWRIGSKEWNDSDAAGTANFYPMGESWKTYRPVAVPGANPRFSLPDEQVVGQQFDLTVSRFIAREIDPQVKDLQSQLAQGETPALLNQLGVLYGRYGLLGDARAQFTKAAGKGSPDAYINLGSVEYLQKRYAQSVAAFKQGLAARPNDPTALLGLARSQYELEDFGQSDDLYSHLRQVDPQMAAGYSYLGSIVGGQGRAYSFADRLKTTRWALADGTGPMITQLLVTPSPSPVGTARPSSKPSASPSPKPTASPSLKPTVAPTATPKPNAVATPVPPTATPPIAIANPTPTPGAVATAQPSLAPDATPTPQPTGQPTVTGEPTAAPTATPDSRGTALKEDFAGIVKNTGVWTFGNLAIAQTNPREYFGKAALPFAANDKALQYRVQVRSSGSGWVGLGLHLNVRDSKYSNGFGAGKSLLIWLTVDPAKYGDRRTHLQVYRSVDDINMQRVTDLIVPESLHEELELRVQTDPRSGNLRIYLNDQERYAGTGYAELGAGSAVIFRALERAEFRNIRIEELP